MDLELGFIDNSSQARVLPIIRCTSNMKHALLELQGPAMEPRAAPEWQTTDWLNTPEPLQLASFRGRVVFLHAFQILCPGCVSHAIPQAQRVAELFKSAPVTVIGLHTVFEHHAAMGLESLRAFVHEYRVRFPVGIDAPGLDGESMPRTMRAYAMQGTPTAILIDARGRLRRQVFGLHDDLLLGAEIGTLLAEAKQGSDAEESIAASVVGQRTDGRCGLG